jgi:threonine synthase
MAESTAGKVEAKGARVVIVCTGHGMKDPSVIIDSFDSPKIIPALYDALVELVNAGKT